VYPWFISLPLAHAGEFHAGDLLIVVPLALITLAGILAVVRAGRSSAREVERGEDEEVPPSEEAGPIERGDRTFDGEQEVQERH
jgi:hypothetical protein